MENLRFIITCLFFVFSLLLTFAEKQATEWVEKRWQWYCANLDKAEKETRGSDVKGVEWLILIIKKRIDKIVDEADKFDEIKYSNKIFRLVTFFSMSAVFMAICGSTEYSVLGYLGQWIFAAYLVFFLLGFFFKNPKGLIINDFLYSKIVFIVILCYLINFCIFRDENDNWFIDFGRYFIIILSSYGVLLRMYIQVLKIDSKNMNYSKLAISIMVLTVHMLAFEVYSIGNYGETSLYYDSFSINGGSGDMTYFDAIYYTVGTLLGNPPGEIYPINRIGKLLSMKIFMTTVFCMGYLVEKLISKQKIKEQREEMEDCDEE